jgi:hypothetical protein
MVRLSLCVCALAGVLALCGSAGGTDASFSLCVQICASER